MGSSFWDACRCSARVVRINLTSKVAHVSFAKGSCDEDVFRLLAAVFVTAVPLAAPVIAGDDRVWVGRDVNDSSIHWTVADHGSSWVLKSNGAVEGNYAINYRGDGYVEMKSVGISSYSRIRLYSDRLQVPGIFGWTTLAKGRFHD